MDGLWPSTDAAAAKNRFTLQRKKHSSQLWYWQIGVIAQEHKQPVNDWLAEVAPKAGTNKFLYTTTEGEENEILYNYIPLDGELGAALHAGSPAVCAVARFWKRWLTKLYA